LVTVYFGRQAALLEADYVVVGCGAAGMAFADLLIAHSDATVAMIDRRARSWRPLE